MWEAPVRWSAGGAVFASCPSSASSGGSDETHRIRYLDVDFALDGFTLRRWRSNSRCARNRLGRGATAVASGLQLLRFLLAVVSSLTSPCFFLDRSLAVRAATESAGVEHDNARSSRSRSRARMAS